jgi:hypothetical protein
VNALLHLDIKSAFFSNPMVFILTIVCCYELIRFLAQRLNLVRFPDVLTEPRFVKLTLIGFILFGVIRNLVKLI